MLTYTLHFLNLGAELLIVAMIIIFTFYCMIQLQSATSKFFFLLVNAILLVVLWRIFYDPIVTIFILVMGVGGFIIYTIID